MSSQRISGTFSGTGNSNAVSCNAAAIDLTFAGTATVNIQWCVDGTNFRTIEAITASTQYTFDNAGVNVPIRLNCSAHTDNVTYAIVTR